ncbi:MAG: MMPL family transporter [Acidobacteria bacterium]|nr:MMPL family transporter [Acidobacteriota bacterium]
MARFWIEFLSEHRLLVFAGISLFTLVCAVGISRLKYSNSIADLLPVNDRQVSNYLHVIKDFGVSEDIVLAVEQKDGNVQNEEMFLDIFMEMLKKDRRYHKLLHGVDYNLSGKLKLIFNPFFLSHVSLLIPGNRLPEFINRLEPENMKEIIMKNRELLETGTGSSMLVDKDPLRLLGMLSSLSSQMKGKYALDFPDGYYASRDHTLFLAFLKPTGSADNMQYTEKVMRYLMETRVAAMKEYREELDEPCPLSARFTGAHAITYFDREVMQNDMTSTFLLSFLLVILTFVIAYRSPFSVVYAMVPLLLGELWTFGLAYFIIGKLNILTSVSAAIIVGLGIDFAIHIYSRFLDEMVEQNDVRAALHKTMTETGASTIAGALTTAAAFAAMSVSSFRGLREFGIIASVGILCTLLAVCTVLPLMFLMRKRLYKPKQLTSFGLHLFHNLIDRHAKGVFIFFTIVTVILLGSATQLKFTTDMRHLRSKTNPAIRLQTEITAKLKASFRALSLILSADNERELSARYEKLRNYLNTCNIAKIESIYSIVPPMDHQLKNIGYLVSHPLPTNIKKRFHRDFDEAGMVCDKSCSLYISALADSLKIKKPLSLHEVLESPMAPLFSRLVHERNGRMEMIVSIYPKAATWNKKKMGVLVQQIDNFLQKQKWEKTYLTGIEIMVNEIKRLIKENFYLATFLSLLFVFAIVAIHQHSLLKTGLSFFPLVAGIIWMLGILKLSGRDITLYNFMATPMIIGIGIDHGIHLLDRYISGESGGIADTIVHTGKAITLTSLTTVFGFGSLFIGHFEGFVSLGFTSILGVVSCWAASLFYFPSFLKLLHRHLGSLRTGAGK